MPYSRSRVKSQTSLELRTKDLWLHIREGQPDPIGLASLSAYKRKQTPLLETRYSISSKIWRTTHLTNKEVLDLIMKEYQKALKEGKFYKGRYGDWVKCTQTSLGPKGRKQKILVLDFIANASWQKPTLAADLAIFVQAGTHIYFIGIRRKNDPGKGLPAMIGGIQNAAGVLDSAAYTVIKETYEEGHLKIQYLGDLDKLRENYTIQEIPVIVAGFEKIDPALNSLEAKIHYITTIPTSDVEKNPDGTKRVYQTTGFALFIPIKSFKITDKDLSKIFQAGDDADAMFYQDVSPCFKKEDFSHMPPFGIEHHKKLFKDSVKFLKNYYHL